MCEGRSTVLSKLWSQTSNEVHVYQSYRNLDNWLLQLSCSLIPGLLFRTSKWWKAGWGLRTRLALMWEVKNGLGLRVVWIELCQGGVAPCSLDSVAGRGSLSTLRQVHIIHKHRVLMESSALHSHRTGFWWPTPCYRGTQLGWERAFVSDLPKG